MSKTFFIAVCLFLISAGPASAAERQVMYGPESYTVTNTSEYVSPLVSVVDFTEILFQFDFDTTTLDKTPVQDSLSFGWIDENGVRYKLGDVLGMVGADPLEIDSVTVPVAPTGMVRMYASVSSNTASDQAILSNIMLTGLKKENPTLCAFERGDVKGFLKGLKAASRTKEGEWIRSFIKGEVRNCLPAKPWRL